MTKTNIWKAYPIFKHAQQGFVPKNLQIIASPKKRRQQQQQQTTTTVPGRAGAQGSNKKNNDHKKSLAYRTVHEMQKR